MPSNYASPPGDSTFISSSSIKEAYEDIHAHLGDQPRP